MMKCKICGSPSTLAFKAKVLYRYDVSYFECPSCDFIQTEEPYWLEEAYQDAVSIYDVWSVSRPLLNAAIVSRLIDNYVSNAEKPFMDYGGGSGLFVRRMRDLGYDFLRYDAYSKNLYARFFDVNDYEKKSRYSLITSFEVFEHLIHPVEDVKAMFELSDTIFFSTNLVPHKVKNADDWDYIAPYHGQHVSFHTKKSLHSLAESTGSFLFTDGKSFHLLSKHNYKITDKEFQFVINGYQNDPFKKIFKKAGNYLLKLSENKPRRTSLTEKDSEFVIRKLNERNGEKNNGQ